MTFEEFKGTYDHYYAYLDWYTVSFAKAVGRIPKEFHPAFDDFCVCGSENIITTSLTQMMCCDPYCSEKQGYKLAKLMSNFSMDGVGPAICKSVYGRLTYLDRKEKESGGTGFLKTSSHLEILLVPYERYPYDLQSVAGRKFFEAAMEIRSSTITFPKLIGMLGLKGFDGNSEMFFKGIDSYAQLKDEIIAKGGIKPFCISRNANAPMKACDLKVALPDIHLANFVFASCLRSTGLRYLDICITGSIKLHGSAITKSAFVKQCNDVCRTEDGVQLYEVRMTGAIEHNAFVLYSVSSSSSKFKKGSSRPPVTDEFGTHPVLMTVDDFYSLLVAKVEEIKASVAGTAEEVCTAAKAF